jgi:hypothetical protein
LEFSLPERASFGCRAMRLPQPAILFPRRAVARDRISGGAMRGVAVNSRAAGLLAISKGTLEIRPSRHASMERVRSREADGRDP